MVTYLPYIIIPLVTQFVTCSRWLMPNSRLEVISKLVESISLQQGWDQFIINSSYFCLYESKPWILFVNGWVDYKSIYSKQDKKKQALAVPQCCKSFHRQSSSPFLWKQKQHSSLFLNKLNKIKKLWVLVLNLPSNISESELHHSPVIWHTLSKVPLGLCYQLQRETQWL